jgi:hypothetical protein
MNKSAMFRDAHSYARDFFANARYPRHELRHKTYAEAFAEGLRIEHTCARLQRLEAARKAAGLPKVIAEGTRAYAELATDGRLR